jgi:hypothetical protein
MIATDQSETIWTSADTPPRPWILGVHFFGNGNLQQGLILNLSLAGCRGSSEGALGVLVYVPCFLAPI